MASLGSEDILVLEWIWKKVKKYPQVVIACVQIASRSLTLHVVNFYSAELSPVGRQREDAYPTSELEMARAAHGLLHGLAAIHRVRDFLKRHCEYFGCLLCLQQIA